MGEWVGGMGCAECVWGWGQGAMDSHVGEMWARASPLQGRIQASWHCAEQICGHQAKAKALGWGRAAAIKCVPTLSGTPILPTRKAGVAGAPRHHAPELSLLARKPRQ